MISIFKEIFCSFSVSRVKVGKMRNPSGLAYDLNGRLFLAEYGNHRLQVF